MSYNEFAPPFPCCNGLAFHSESCKRNEMKNKDPTRQLCHFLELMLVPQSEITKYLASKCLDNLKDAINEGSNPNLETVFFAMQKMIGTDFVD